MNKLFDKACEGKGSLTVADLTSLLKPYKTVLGITNMSKLKKAQLCKKFIQLKELIREENECGYVHCEAFIRKFFTKFIENWHISDIAICEKAKQLYNLVEKAIANPNFNSANWRGFARQIYAEISPWPDGIDSIDENIMEELTYLDDTTLRSLFDAYKKDS